MLCYVLLVSVAPAWCAETDDLFPLGLSLDEQQLSSPHRTPRPISRIAENVTVITAEQIEQLNAHTLEEVLQNVPGIQFSQIRTPGSWSAFHINGLDFNHVLVILDGIVQNDLVNNFPDVGIIPARQIERIEIIKGSASAAWGPALGGVINIVSKSADPERKSVGSVVATYGERGTTELNGETGGTLDRFGYYLAGGTFHSKGLRPGNGINFNHLWGKFSYSLPTNGTLTFGGNLRDVFRGLEESAPLNYRDTDDLVYYHFFTDLTQPISDDLSLDIAVKHHAQRDKTILGSITPDPEMPPYIFSNRQSVTSTSAKLLWDEGNFSLLAGSDFDHHDIRTSWQYDKTLNRWAVYLNGSLTFGRFTLLPGLRYDHTAIANNPTSYTLGATWQVNDSTTVRGYAAKGYGLSNLAYSKNIQQIATYQLGSETSSIPYLWLKGTLFYNRIWDIESPFDPEAPLRKETRQGAELEVRTVPVGGVTLSSGYTFTDNRDRDTRKAILFSPEHSWKIGVNYASSFGLKTHLNGNYVWWNGDSSSKGHYTPIIWDLTLTQQLLPGNELSPEIFFSGHNLFNGSQYIMELYRNTPRWVEGGVRFKF